MVYYYIIIKIGDTTLRRCCHNTILSKVYENLVSHKPSSFWEKYGFLPAAQFTIGKV